MSGVLSAIGKVAGVIAMIPSPIQPIAAAVAVVASVGAALTAKKPAPVGGTSEITIGANMPSPYGMGEFYTGGNRVHQVGYGEEDDVPNAHLWVVDVVSVGGPLSQFLGAYADFNLVSFDGTGAAFNDGNAIGYYKNNFHRMYQLGATPETGTLMPHWSGAPDWGLSYKLSGKAAVGWSARWPEKKQVFGAGFPQTGSRWRGVRAYDPRLDSTYPGGAGPQRWASPTDKAAFSAAKPTWPYSANPGLHGLRYALGIWERDESNPAAEYRKVFGIGGSWDQIVVSDFVEFANVCDANGWTVDGVIYEGGAEGERWANLKRILAAGGAEPVFKGARLGLKINAPRISLDTITMDDIAEGECTIPGNQPYENRKNTLVPYYISFAHKNESVASSPVQVLSYVEEDGEERSEDWRFDLVTKANQAAQLAAYELVGRREQGPIALPLKPRMRRYSAGAQLSVSPEVKAFFGIQKDDLIIIGKTTDPGPMSWAFTFVTDDPDKHEFALSRTGTSPPAPTIVPPEEIDGAGGAGRGAYTLLTMSPPYPVTSDDDSITIEAFSGVLSTGQSVSFAAGSVDGLASGTTFGLFWHLEDETYVASVSPSAAEWASTNYVFLRWVTTSTAGSYPTPTNPPPGDGGGSGIPRFENSSM